MVEEKKLRFTGYWRIWRAVGIWGLANLGGAALMVAELYLLGGLVMCGAAIGLLHHHYTGGMRLSVKTTDEPAATDSDSTEPVDE